MPHCAVIGCTNNNRYKKDGIVTFHRIPKDPKHRARWIKAIDRPKWEPPHYAAVCSAHFPEADMDRTSLSVVRVREGVVPSIFNGVVKKYGEETMPCKSVDKTVEAPKITFEELIMKRARFKNELSEVNQELIVTRREIKRLCQVKRRTSKKSASMENLLSSGTIAHPREELELELQGLHQRLVTTEEEIVTLNESREAISARKSDLLGKLKSLPEPLKFKLDTLTPPQDQSVSAAAGSSKRPIGNLVGEGKNQKERLTKRRKIINEDEEDESDVPEDCPEEPCEMIEIEEPTIKQEVFEIEEFIIPEVKNDGVLPVEEFNQEKVHLERVFCTPAIIKEEYQDDVETPRNPDLNNTNPLIPEFMLKEIKVEPLEVGEEEEKVKEQEDSEEYEEEPINVSSLMWRCPLVTCPEMFSRALQVFDHLRLNHVVVRDPATSSEPERVTGTSSAFIESTTRELPNQPSFEPIPVPTSQSMPSSSSGPVTVTTTSLAISPAPLVTKVSNSPISPTPSAMLISKASSSGPVISSSRGLSDSPPTSCHPVSPHVLVSTTSDLSPLNPSVDVTTSVDSSTSSPNPPPVPNCSQGLQKIKLPVGDRNSGSTGLKICLLPHQQQQNSASETCMGQSLQIFHPSESTTEDLPSNATDDSETFSISLAGFPENRRVPIKRKLIDVVDCMRQKNVSPEKLLIAYYDNSSHSRTM